MSNGIICIWHVTGSETHTTTPTTTTAAPRKIESKYTNHFIHSMLSCSIVWIYSIRVLRKSAISKLWSQTDYACCVHQQHILYLLTRVCDYRNPVNWYPRCPSHLAAWCEGRRKIWELLQTLPMSLTECGLIHALLSTLKQQNAVMLPKNISQGPKTLLFCCSWLPNTAYSSKPYIRLPYMDLDCWTPSL